MIIDIHESPLFFADIRQAIPDAVQRNININSYPDVYWVCEGVSHGCECKQWSEILGKLDKLEEQLSREYQQVDKLYLLIRGMVTPWKQEDDPQGTRHCMAWEQSGNMWWRPQKRENGWYQSYRGLQTFLHRLNQYGIEVIQLASHRDMANLVVDLFNDSSIPLAQHRTFKRVIQLKPDIGPDYPPAKLKLIRQIMGLQAGIGEEIAEAFAELAIQRNWSFFQLLELVKGEHNLETFSKLPLRSGKRTIGPAAVHRFREAVA